MSRTFAYDAELPSALVNAASWRLAAELVAGIPGAVITQEYNGGGQYDELHVATNGDDIRLSINRNGSLHVLKAPREAASVPLWPAACRPGAAEHIAKRALDAAGCAVLPRNRSGARLGYEVLAHILTARALDSIDWDAIWLNDRGRSRGVRKPLPAELDADPADTWALTAGTSTVAWFYGGWAVLPGGERVDLTRRRAGGASLADLAALVTRRDPASTALPLLDQPPSSSPLEQSRPWLDYALRYNAYARLAGDLDRLADLFAPVRHEYRTTGTVPAWCNLDLLRGWLFLLVREDHFAGGYLLEDPQAMHSREFLGVAEAISLRSSEGL